LSLAGAALPARKTQQRRAVIFGTPARAKGGNGFRLNGFSLNVVDDRYAGVSPDHL